MKKSIVCALALMTSMAQAYKGERCIDAAILSGVRSIQNVTADILGKVCTILIKVCNIQDCTPFPISQPMTITESGSYCVSRNLTGNGADPVLIIDVDSVCIDLACHIIDGAGVPAISVSDRNKILIDNGCVTTTGATVVSLTTVDQATFHNVQFQGGDTGFFAQDCCDVVVEACQFTGAAIRSIWLDQCNLARVVDCGICESDGQYGIQCTASQGLFIDPTILSDNNLTTAGLLLSNCSGAVIEGLQIARNGFGTAPEKFTGILGENNSQDVKILTPSIYELVATTSLRGIDGLDQSGWTIKCASISDLEITITGSIDGIRNGESAFVDSCQLTEFRAANNSTTTIAGIVGGANSRYTNNYIADFANDASEGFSSTLNGFLVTVNNTHINNNFVADLVRTGGGDDATSAAYNIGGFGNRVNNNIRAETPGVNGYIIDNTTQNSLFANQGHFTAGVTTFVPAIAFPATPGSPALVTYTVGTGLYGPTPPVPSTNIEILA